MKVKIGDEVYDGAEQPVMVILSPEDKQNISNMEPHADRYCSYPEEMSPQEAREFMKTTWEDDDIGQPIAKKRISTTIGCPKGTLYGGDCCGCIIGEYNKEISAYLFSCNECGEEVGSGGFEK